MNFKPLHNIAKITLTLTFLVIIAGAVVRMTGSGMGCPDWPKCFGYYVPPTNEAQLQWQDYKNYKKGQVIIVNQTLKVAKQDFTTNSLFNKINWETYIKHNYATFNAKHTWVEYINRLFGALAGLATLFLAFYSIKYWKYNKLLTLLSWLTVFGMGFQAWLGKTVVDSNLSPFKITIHMVMALVIVAILLYLISLTKTKKTRTIYSKHFKQILKVALLLTLFQVILGTQVRQFIDEQIKLLGESNKVLWLQDPTLQFYIHRTFSIFIFLINLLLFYKNKKLLLGYTKMNWVLILLILEIISGITMYYFDFPFGTQTIHIVLATFLFGVQFYIFLEAKKSVQQIESL